MQVRSFLISSWLLIELIATAFAVADENISRDNLNPFFASYCNDCHASGADEGGFNLDAIGSDLGDPATFAKWERVFDRVHSGEMPPKDSDSVPQQDREAFVRLLATPLTQVHAAHKGTIFRRLNRREYQNTMNDIFGTNLNLESRLPQDGRSHEFDNIGEALGISMVHLQQYLTAADDVIAAATMATVERPETNTLTASYAETDEGKKFIGEIWKKLPDNSVVFFSNASYPTGMLRGTEVKPPGRYKVRVSGYAYQSDRPITIRIGGTSFLRGSEKLTYGYAELPPGAMTTIEMEVDIQARYMIEIDACGIDTGNFNIRKDGLDNYKGPGIAINQVELTGPIIDEFPGRGHKLLYGEFVRTPTKTHKFQREQLFELSADEPRQAAEKTLLAIAAQAFRRTVSPSDVARYVGLFQQQLEEGSTLEAALRSAVAAVFCSPDFLYLNEPDGWLTDDAIAARLAYFLTRTTPDDELRSVAAAGQLSKAPAALLTQTRRLLDDPKHQRFVVDFCDVWLNLRDIEFTSPDQQLFPEYDEYLQYSMLQETRQFVAKMIADNLPVTNLVKSDFAMLNDRLAEHYEIKDVTGPTIRPVELPSDSLRGGLLSQASILKVSANGTNTSPVVRGVWVTERILGRTPQPPPPEIPGIEPDIRGATTLRELLEKHRDLDSCRDCHAKIDPPGFALECFDPIGGYRERFRSLGDGDKVNFELAGRKVRYKLGPQVDASGTLADGTQFAGYQEFREYLVAHPDILATALTTKLLTFATGRELGFSDRPLVAGIVAKAEDKGYRVGDLIDLVVTSQAFRMK